MKDKTKAFVEVYQNQTKPKQELRVGDVHSIFRAFPKMKVECKNNAIHVLDIQGETLTKRSIRYSKIGNKIALKDGNNHKIICRNI